jgi:hypothetical protein
MLKSINITTVLWGGSLRMFKAGYSVTSAVKAGGG